MKPSAKHPVILLSFLTLGSFIYGQTDDRSQRTREFVVMGYQGIQLELASGKGPYLRTLFDLLRTPSGTETKTTDRLKGLLKTYPNIMDFADQVVLLESVSQETNGTAATTPMPSGPGIYSGEKLVGALEHLTKGMTITVHLKTGERLKGTFSEYAAKRLWIRGAARRSVSMDDILALEAPQL